MEYLLLSEAADEGIVEPAGVAADIAAAVADEHAHRNTFPGPATEPPGVPGSSPENDTASAARLIYPYRAPAALRVQPSHCGRTSTVRLLPDDGSDCRPWGCCELAGRMEPD